MKSLIAALALLGASEALANNNCDHTATRQAEVSASGVNTVVIDAEAGFLKVKGIAGLTTIRARGTACASTEDLLREVRLSASLTSGRARVQVSMPESLNWRGRTARLDLVVEVPAGVNIDVDDGSGDTTIENVGSVDIEDGSGELEIRETRGAVNIDDGSGEIELRSIGGDVTIDDGSGSIEIEDVTGSVDLDDSSGSIDVAGIRGNVTIEDSSGSIEVSDVGGNFTVRSDSSGGIRHANVRGQVRLPRDRD